MSNQDTISIITVVKNGKKSLEKAIQSVISQEYLYIEYIIIDGGSTDGTLEVIMKYNNKISYWVSEADEGIYHAMNKGLQAAKGQWIFFLGADDYLIDNYSISKLAKYIDQDTKMIFGNVIYSNGYYFRSRMTPRILISNTVHHQGCIYSSKLFTNFNYDINTKVYGDYELNLMLFLRKHRFCHVNETISFCQVGGASSTSKKAELREVNTIRGKHINPILNILISQIYYLLAYLAKLKQCHRDSHLKALRSSINRRFNS
jgi:putative colanic acid biosynthesis glycosyltransferase